MLNKNLSPSIKMPYSTSISLLENRVDSAVIAVVLNTGQLAFHQLKCSESDDESDSDDDAESEGQGDGER